MSFSEYNSVKFHVDTDKDLVTFSIFNGDESDLLMKASFTPEQANNIARSFIVAADAIGLFPANGDTEE